MKKNKELVLEPPLGERKVLLHTCCAPCSSAIIEIMLKQGLEPVIYYSNSNIYPFHEYQKRKDECTRYAKEKGLEVYDDDYNHQDWRLIAKGLEHEPERGQRCLFCFKYRLARAALFAKEHGIKVITSTLASSRWKNLEQVNEAGLYACSKYEDVYWWDQNWRKYGLQERRNAIIKEMNFYNQDYCGCEFSIINNKNA